VAHLSEILGFSIGLVFGAVGLLSGFCLMSGLRDCWAAGDGRKLRSYVLALAIAILGTQILGASGLVDLTSSIYLQGTFSVPIMLLGGIMFGLGMVFSNGCASRALVLLGKGNLRSLTVVTVIGITAQMTLKGLLAPARLQVLAWTKSAPAAVSVPALLNALGVSDFAAHLLPALALSGGLFAFTFSSKAFRQSYTLIVAGAVMGFLVVAGWLTTGWLAVDDFNPVPAASLTFVSPIAETIQYTMLSTGLSLNFGISVVAGVLAGSLTAAILSGRFEFEGYTSASQMGRSVAGAALMGIGGALAYGCSVGQGLTGISTLSMPSFIAVAGILFGAAIGIRGRSGLPAFASR